MIECTLINIHTGGEIQYLFDFIPRVGENIMINTYEMRDNKEWQDFAGADEDNPNFEGLSTRQFQVCAVNHWISPNHKTSIEILLDEYYGE